MGCEYDLHTTPRRPLHKSPRSSLSVFITTRNILARYGLYTPYSHHTSDLFTHPKSARQSVQGTQSARLVLYEDGGAASPRYSGLEPSHRVPRSPTGALSRSIVVAQVSGEPATCFQHPLSVMSVWNKEASTSLGHSRRHVREPLVVIDHNIRTVDYPEQET